MMQKQTQLSKREVVLLIIAGILLVSFASYKYLITPMMNKYNRAIIENDKLQWNNQEALMYPGSIESNKKVLTKIKDELTEKSSLFEDKADSLKVDEEITSLLQSNSITPVSVQIENGIRIEKGKPANGTSENKNTNDLDAEKKEENSPAVYKFNVKVQALGSLENAKKVFDAVSNSTDRKIIRFDLVEGEKSVLNFTFIVYVRDPFELKDGQ